MKISDDRTLSELQEEFRQEFPFLKMAFYSRPSLSGAEGATVFYLNEAMHVGQVRGIHNAGFIVLDSTITVDAFYKTFRDIFGLHVQVFRNSFGQWLQVRSSIGATLREQNIRGLMAQPELARQY